MIGFTPRESAIAACLLDGLHYGDAADAVGTSMASFRNGVRGLMRRLSCGNRYELRDLLHEIDRQEGERLRQWGYPGEPT